MPKRLPQPCIGKFADLLTIRRVQDFQPADAEGYRSKVGEIELVSQESPVIDASDNRRVPDLYVDALAHFSGARRRSRNRQCQYRCANMSKLHKVVRPLGWVGGFT